jgi:hypothetical protein
MGDVLLFLSGVLDFDFNLFILSNLMISAFRSLEYPDNLFLLAISFNLTTVIPCNSGVDAITILFI